MPGRRSLPTLLLLVPLVLAAAAYARTLHGPYLFDDEVTLVGEAARATPGAILRSAGSDLLRGGRPVTALTFAWTRAADGISTLGHHLGNLALHLAVVVLVFAFTRAVLRRARSADDGWVALVVAGVFALHPLQSEAVAYMTQRAEVLSSALYLATLLVLLRLDGRRSAAGRVLLVAAALALFLLGMGAKAIVVTAPLAWLLLLAVVPPRAAAGAPSAWPARLGAAAALVLAGAVLAAGLLRGVEGHADAGFSVPRSDPGSYFLTQWRAVATYLRLLAWPAGQNAEWSMPLSRSALEPAVLASGALLLGLLALAAGLWLRFRGRDDPEAGDARAAAYGILWFFLLLAPTSSLVPIADVLVEHRAYLASWGPILAFTLGARRLLLRLAPDRAGVAAAVAAGVASCGLALALHLRNAVWEDDLRFWSDAAAKSPTKARPRLGLGVALARRGQADAARRSLQEGLALAPVDATGLRVALHHNLGGVLLASGRPAEAVPELRRAVELDPAGVEPREALALALWQAGDAAAAEAEAAEVLSRVPSSPGAARVMGHVRMARGDDAGAVPVLEVAVRARPMDGVVRYDLGAAYANLGRIAEACASWKAVLATPAGPETKGAARQAAATVGCPP